MATLATISNRFLDASSVAELSASRGNPTNSLRALPNEDVYFFLKKLDNSRVVREANPQASRHCWHSVLGTLMVALMITGLLLPGAYSLFAGYQIESLRTKQQGLEQERDRLDNEVAKLLSPSRLETLARKQEFIEPAADKVVYLNPKADAAMSARLQP